MVQRRWRGFESRTTHAWWESVQYTDRNVHTNITLLIESSISLHFVWISRTIILKILSRKDSYEIYKKKFIPRERERKRGEKKRSTTILILRLSPSFSLTTLIRIKTQRKYCHYWKTHWKCMTFYTQHMVFDLSTTGSSSSSSFHPRSCPSSSSSSPPSVHLRPLSRLYTDNPW